MTCYFNPGTPRADVAVVRFMVCVCFMALILLGTFFFLIIFFRALDTVLILESQEVVQVCVGTMVTIGCTHERRCYTGTSWLINRVIPGTEEYKFA